QAASAAAKSATIVRAVNAFRGRISPVLLEFRLLRLDLAGYCRKGQTLCHHRRTRSSAERALIRTKTMERLGSSSGGRGSDGHCASSSCPGAQSLLGNFFWWLVSGDCGGVPAGAPPPRRRVVG